MSVLATLHNEHKARQQRLKQAALKELTKPIAAIPEPIPQAQIHVPLGITHIFDIILVEICDYYGVRRIDILSHRRQPFIMKPRRMLLYMIYHMTSFTIYQAGPKINRDPSSIAYAIRKVRADIASHQPDIDELAARIGTELARVRP